MSESAEPPKHKRSLVVRLLLGFLYVLLGLVVLVFLLAALPGFEVVLEFAFHVAAGWILYLRAVTSQVTLNGGLIASSLVALSVAILGLHHLAGWLWRRSQPEAGPWAFRWTAAITTMLLLFFASANAGAGIGHQIGWLKSMRWVESSSLGYFGLAREGNMLGKLIDDWADDHNDHYPLTILETTDGQLDEPQKFVLVSWPSDSTPEPWLYFGRLYSKRPMESKQLPLLASPRSYRGKRVVVHTDGGTGLMAEEQFQSLVAEMRTNAQFGVDKDSP